MDESFNLDDIEQLEFEKNALFLNTDEVSVCSCRSTCLKECGRNACPCKSMGNYCSEACHGDSNAEYPKSTCICMNRRRLIEGDSSDDSDDSTFQLDEEFVSISNLIYIIFRSIYIDLLFIFQIYIFILLLLLLLYDNCMQYIQDHELDHSLISKCRNCVIIIVTML